MSALQALGGCSIHPLPTNIMSKRQKYIFKISKTMTLMMNYIIHGQAHKALGMVRDLESDLVELRKVEQ